MSRYITIFWFFSLSGYSLAQQIDEIDNLISKAYSDENYDAIMSLIENYGDSSLFLQLSNTSIRRISRSYFSLGKYEKTINTSKISLDFNLSKEDFFQAYVDCYYISSSFKYLYELDSAIKYSKMGLEFAQATNSKVNISRALHNQAILLENKNDYTNALLLYQKSIDLIKDDSVELMQTKSNISNIYYKIGILDSAFEIASNTYRYFLRNTDNKNLRWLSTYRLAYIEEDYRNELAASYYQELLTISETEYDQALAEIGLGETFLKKQNDSALYYFDLASQKANTSQSKMLLREINFNKAKIYLGLNPNQALLKKSLQNLREILDTQKADRAELMYGILESKYFLNENNLRRSLASIDSTILNAQKFRHKDRLSQALSQKFKVLNHFGRYKEALAVKEEEIKVREELFNDRSEAVYQILRTQNEMDKQESTIANQALVIDNNNLQITIQYISIALVIVALIFIFWQYRTRSKYAQKLETMFLDSRHRYMNNLLLLKNWFNEGKTEKNDEIISFAQNRIDAISTVNRHLDRLSYNKDTIEAKPFLEDISHNLLANREFTSDIENVPINMNVSGPLGMITNEIITNGLKYGEPPYAIRFHKNGNGYVLEIEDHGPGIETPEKQGTGSKVLRLLSRQLKGELTYQNKASHTAGEQGTLVSLRFKG